MNRSLQSGGILVVVLSIMLLTTAITAGWLVVMTSQLAYVEEFSAGTQRRIALNNATALARQYLLVSALTKNSGSGAGADLGDGWGSVAIPASSGAPLTTFQSSSGENPFNPGNGGGYTEDLVVTMAAGGDEPVRRFQMRSRSLALSGTLAVFQAPVTAVSGTLAVSGQTLLWNPAGTYSVTTASYTAPSQPAAVLSNIAPGNFPFVPQTGSEIAGAPNYQGQLNVVANTSGINSLVAMAAASAPNGMQTITGSDASDEDGVHCDGSGNVTIDLLDHQLGNVVITGNVTHLTFTGQTTAADRTSAGNAAAVLVVVNQTAPPTNLTEVNFTNSNNRRLALAIKTASGSATTFRFPQAGTSTWRLLMTLEATPVTFDLGGASQIIVGGLQSDRAVSVSSGSLSLSAETDPKLLDRLAPRTGWIEAYTQ